jgi:hypothetical protein
LAVSSPNLARSQAKIEDLPSDGGRVVDTLAGALLRVFVRLNEMERAFGELRKRVGLLEERPAIRPAPATTDFRRTRKDGQPDTRGSTAAARFAHRQARSAADTATDLLGNGS